MILSFGRTVSATDETLSRKVLFDSKRLGHANRKDHYPSSKPTPILPNPRQPFSFVEIVRLHLLNLFESHITLIFNFILPNQEELELRLRRKISQRGALEFMQLRLPSFIIFQYLMQTDMLG